MPKYLNEKLECPDCGTITLDIPDDAVETSQIHCSQCKKYLGEWGDLQDSFSRQAGAGVFDVSLGRFARR